MQNNDQQFIILRIINNNVVVSKDENNTEIVLMGKGIAYLKKVGDFIDAKIIEKTFILKEKEKSRFLEAFEYIQPQFFEIAIKILDQVEEQLKIKPTSIATIMLADHISSAVERVQDNIELKNEMLSEIKNFYSKEFELGKKALEIIKEFTQVELSIDEAGFVAYHIINLSNFGNEESSDKKIQLIHKVVDIVESYFEMEINKESIYYDRFITHLKYFGNRVFSDSASSEQNIKDDFVFRMLKIQYPETTKCVNLINEYLKHNYKIEIQSEEKGYLMIHINNLLNKSKIVTKKG